MPVFYFVTDPGGRALAYPNRDLVVLDGTDLPAVDLLPGFNAVRCETGTPGKNRREARKLNRVLSKKGMVHSTDRRFRRAKDGQGKGVEYASALIAAIDAGKATPSPTG